MMIDHTTNWYAVKLVNAIEVLPGLNDLLTMEEFTRLLDEGGGWGSISDALLADRDLCQTTWQTIVTHMTKTYDYYGFHYLMMAIPEEKLRRMVGDVRVLGTERLYTATLPGYGRVLTNFPLMDHVTARKLAFEATEGATP